MSEPAAAAPARRLRALIVEDEWPARDYLVELVEDSQLAEVVGAVANSREARQALSLRRQFAVDVVFVDVKLSGDGDEAGLRLVRDLVREPSAPLFVLATAFAKHAVEAFDLELVDYLLKPFTAERVAQCLRRVLARRKLSQVSNRSRILARRGKTLVFLEPEEVLAFEAADRLTRVHSFHRRFDVDLTLTTIEGSFGRPFIRVHRNWLVNARLIRELERDGREMHIFVASDLGPERRGIVVPVSRELAPALRDQLLLGTTGLRRNRP